MIIYADKITMDFNTEYHPPHCERQCVNVKNGRLQCISKDIIIVKRLGI